MNRSWLFNFTKCHSWLFKDKWFNLLHFFLHELVICCLGASISRTVPESGHLVWCRCQGLGCCTTVCSQAEWKAMSPYKVCYCYFACYNFSLLLISHAPAFSFPLSHCKVEGVLSEICCLIMTVYYTISVDSTLSVRHSLHSAVFKDF